MGARRRRLRTAAGAAAVAALALGAVAGCATGASSSSPPTATSTSPAPVSSSASASPESPSSTSSSPTASGSSPSGPSGAFGTGAVTGGTPYPGPAQAHLVRVAVGSHTGFDRLVLDFGGDAVPSFTVTRQSRPVFPQDPSDVPVTLAGTSGVRVVLQGTVRGRSTVENLMPRYPAIRQVRGIGDFEATVSYGVGVLGVARVRVTTLTAPNRLVVDVAWPDPA